MLSVIHSLLIFRLLVGALVAPPPGESKPFTLYVQFREARGAPAAVKVQVVQSVKGKYQTLAECETDSAGRCALTYRAILDNPDPELKVVGYDFAPVLSPEGAEGPTDITTPAHTLVILGSMLFKPDGSPLNEINGFVLNTPERGLVVIDLAPGADRPLAAAGIDKATTAHAYATAAMLPPEALHVKVTPVGTATPLPATATPTATSTPTPSVTATISRSPTTTATPSSGSIQDKFFTTLLIMALLLIVIFQAGRAYLRRKSASEATTEATTDSEKEE